MASSAVIKETVMKKPVVDISDCTRCAGCYDMYPELFELNDVGYVATVERDCYPEDEVDDAIKHCPQDCIIWEDV
jgi:ferredoxin